MLVVSLDDDSAMYYGTGSHVQPSKPIAQQLDIPSQMEQSVMSSYSQQPGGNNMEDLIKAAQALILYIEEEDVYDTSDDDGDGRVDYGQSHTFRDLTNNLQYAIDEAEPTRAAMNTIKEGLIAIVQIGIARQTGQP